MSRVTDKTVWKWVPVEPTDEMLAATADACGHAVINGELHPERRSAGLVYAAILDASPSHPPSAGVDAVREALIEKLRSTPRLIHNPEGQSYGEGWISNDYAMRDVMLQAADYLASLTPAPPPVEGLVSLGAEFAKVYDDNACELYASAANPPPVEAGGEAVQQWRWRYRSGEPAAWRDWKDGQPVVPFSEWNADLYEWETRTVYLAKPTPMVELVREAVEAEREACAKLAENLPGQRGSSPEHLVGRRIALAIRDRAALAPAAQADESEQ